MKFPPFLPPFHPNARRWPAVAAWFCFALAHAATAVAAPRLRIGVETNASPLSFVDSQGRPAGFTAELLREVERAGGIDFEIVAGPWTFILDEFNAGRLEVLANVTILDERRATMDFSIEQASTHGRVYYRTDRPALRTTADLAGKTIATHRGSIAHSNALAHQSWGANLLPCDSWQAAFEATLRGECDGALVIRHYATKFTTEKDLRWSFVDDIIHDFHFAVHKGDSVTLERINEALATVRHNGSFDRIYAKWLGPIEPHPIRLADLRPYLLPGAGLLLGVMTIFGWQRRTLAQRTAQAAILRETEERFRGLVDSAFDGSVLHQDGVIRSVNSAYAAMFGYTVDELIGRPVLDLSPPEVRQHVGSAIATGRETPYESIGLRKDGTHITIETAGKSCTVQGKPARIAAVRDITERKVAEEAIRRLNVDLEQRVRDRTAELARRVAEVERLNADQQMLMRSLTTSQEAADRAAARLQEVNANLLSANQELEAFSYSVSHDLRAPLRNISGFIELLCKRTAGKLDAEAERYTSTVVSETERMGMLLDDLLTFAHLGRTTLRLEPVQLAEVIDEVKLEVHQDLVGRTVEWRVGPLPVVHGDRNLLRQVISNLISNAVKFTRHRPAAVIEIGASASRPDDPTVTFFVRDNGAGFNPKYLDKLFRVFQRLHNARDFEGTGIGLANVKRIITRHRGRIWAEGQVDLGATFYFTLRQAGSD